VNGEQIVGLLQEYTPVERWTGKDLSTLDPRWGSLTVAWASNYCKKKRSLLIVMMMMMMMIY
jgi:hypothetical protein